MLDNVCSDLLYFGSPQAKIFGISRSKSDFPFVFSDFFGEISKNVWNVFHVDIKKNRPNDFVFRLKQKTLFGCQFGDSYGFKFFDLFALQLRIRIANFEVRQNVDAKSLSGPSSSQPEPVRFVSNTKVKNEKNGPFLGEIKRTKR